MFFDLDRLDRTRFLGILVVPDVHGHPQALAEAATRAANDSLFLVQLGDLVDRGPASAKVVALMRDIEAAGVGTFLSGNHEYKLLKYVRSGSYGSPSRVQVHQELHDHGQGLLDWYLSRIADERLFARAPKVLLAHAAYHPEMSNRTPSVSEELRERALFGMRDRTRRKRVRSREWVGEIPGGITVVVGHDVVSTNAVVRESNARGGEAMFLDTGGWHPSGRWSTLTLDWTALGLEMG